MRNSGQNSVGGRLVWLRPLQRRVPPGPLYNPFIAGQQATRIEFLAFQLSQIRAEIESSRAFTPPGCTDRLAGIVSALETEAALIESGPVGGGA